MTEEEIAQFGKGAYTVPDPRDFSFGAVPVPPFDWSQPLEPVLDLKPNYQGSSLSCVGQTTEIMARIRYFKKYGTLKKYSPRYIYSQIYLPNGGAMLRDGVATLLDQGIQTEEHLPTSQPTESSYRSQTGLNRQEADIDYGDADEDEAYAVVPSTIDAMAAAVRDHGVIMIGVYGRNSEWQTADPTCKLPAEWGHAVPVVGARVRNGKKCLQFLNSWGTGWGENGYGYLNEDWFTTPNRVMDGYVITNNFIVKPMLPEGHLVQDVQGSGAFGIVIDGQIRVATADRTDELVLTYIMRGSKGATPLDKKTWDEAQKVNF